MINNLDDIIKFLNEYKKVEWVKSRRFTEDGIKKVEMGHPNYDSRIIDIIKYVRKTYDINSDDYLKFVKEKWMDWEIEELNKERLVYLIIYIYQSENFCDGVVGRYIEDGKLLNIFKELKKR